MILTKPGRTVSFSACARLLSILIILTAAVAGLAGRLAGRGRSLWLDEAWVANASLTSQWTGLLWYGDWLAMPPPGFLILSRLSVMGLGLSERSFRLLPLTGSLLAVWWMWLVTRHVLSWPSRALALALLLLSPVAVEYATTYKQYGIELAVAALLFYLSVLCQRDLTRKRTVVLLLALFPATLIAYPVVFLLPGIAIPLLTGMRDGAPAPVRARFRAALAVLLAGGGIFGVMYALVIRTNMDAGLRVFFAPGRETRGMAGLISRIAGSLWDPFANLPLPPAIRERPLLILCGIVGLAMITFVVTLLSWREGQVNCLWLAGLAPCLVVAVAGGLDLFPVLARTSLFLLPGLVLFICVSLELLGEAWRSRKTRPWPRRLPDVMVLGLALCALATGIQARRSVDLSVPNEDAAAAVRFLREEARNTGILFVHASAAEQFRLYQRILDYHPRTVLFGETGRPCCLRGGKSPAGASTMEQVREDLSRLLPVVPRERLFVMHTLRPGHWAYTGLDEGAALGEILGRRGCHEVLRKDWTGMGVRGYECDPAREKH
ncbi:MAG: hypothetical protein ACKV2V_11350 [Blastocatellia bacterium]